VLLGLHHITALASNPQRNLDFYTQFLGLRLIKRTVNFDDPGTHHLYFGDDTGRPGTLLTFFAWPNAPRGIRGTGQAVGASFAVPNNSLDQWIERARRTAVEYTAPETRFGQDLITLYDPDGLPIELVASAPRSDRGAIVQLHSATLRESHAGRTSTLLTEVLGFEPVAESGNRARFQAGGSFLDIVTSLEEPGKTSTGMVHHIAFRVIDEAEQRRWRAKLTDAGFRSSAVRDRQYFRSVYFREPGGVLFEIATDGPGFLIDESLEDLGSTLTLPAWLETIRDSIERRLPPVTVPETKRLAGTR